MLFRKNFLYFSFYDNEDMGSDGSNDLLSDSLDGSTDSDGSHDSDGFIEPDKNDSNSFTQDDINRFLADDRRKHQERYKKLEGSYQKMLKEGNLHKEQRHKMQQDLEDLQKAFRTKEQQAEIADKVEVPTEREVVAVER